jgi:hypothetical protein
MSIHETRTGAGENLGSAGGGPDAGGPPHAQGDTSQEQLSAADAYGYVCGTALALIGVVLLRRGLFPWAMFPVGAGLLGLFFRWRIAPLLIVGITGSCIVYAEPGGPFFRGSFQRPSAGVVDLQTWILCSALLAYVIGHYRLQALTASIFPPDRRFPRPLAAKNPLERPRWARVADTGEIGWLILTLPFVSFAALIVLRLLPGAQNDFDLYPSSWLTLVLLWILGLGAVVGHGTLVYLGLHNLKPAEARIYVQDLLWLELRRDLRRLNRWVVWSRLRKDR